MATDSFYTFEQISHIKELAKSLSGNISSGSYADCWTRAVELLGLAKPPAANPAPTPALNFSEQDLSVLQSALDAATDVWRKSEKEVTADFAKRTFNSLITDGTLLYRRIHDHQISVLRQRVQAATGPSKSNEDDLARGLARFFMEGYSGALDNEAIIDTCNDLKIFTPARQNILDQIGRDRDSIKVEGLSSEMVNMLARIFLTAKRDWTYGYFNQICNASDLSRGDIADLTDYATSRVGEV